MASMRKGCIHLCKGPKQEITDCYMARGHSLHQVHMHGKAKDIQSFGQCKQNEMQHVIQAIRPRANELS